MKKHIIELTDKENSKIQEIKKDMRLGNVNDTIKLLINEYTLINTILSDEKTI